MTDRVELQLEVDAPAKQEAGAEATVVTLHGVPPMAAPSAPNPWSRVT